MRFSSFGGCERVNQWRMLKWGSTHSAHSLLLHSFTSIKRRKGRNCSQIPRYFACVILQFSPHFLELEFPSASQIPSVFLLTDPGTMWKLINFAKKTNFSILSLFAVLARQPKWRSLAGFDVICAIEEYSINSKQYLFLIELINCCANSFTSLDLNIELSKCLWGFLL